MNDLRDYLTAPARELALPVPHLSATQVGMWDRCKEQFRQRYVLGRKERPGAALVLGGAFHFAQETNFQQKIQSGSDLPVSDVREAFHAGWDSAIDKNGGADEIVWDTKEKPETTRSRGEVLSVQYREQVAPKLQPTSVEQRFDLEVPEVPVPVIGYMDFVGLVDHSRGEIESQFRAVVDYKTSAKKQSSLKADWRMQARIYQMATGLPIEYHVAVKTKDPVIVTPTDEPALAVAFSEVAVNITRKQLARVAREIAWCWAEFGPEQMWPDSMLHPWACGFCGFRETCGWWAA